MTEGQKAVVGFYFLRGNTAGGRRCQSVLLSRLKGKGLLSLFSCRDVPGISLAVASRGRARCMQEGCCMDVNLVEITVCMCMYVLRTCLLVLRTLRLDHETFSWSRQVRSPEKQPLANWQVDAAALRHNSKTRFGWCLAWHS